MFRINVCAMRNRHFIRAVASVCAAAVFVGLTVSPIDASTRVTMVEANGNSAQAASVSSPLTGYYLAASDGGVFAFGDARFYGSMAGMRLNKPVVDIERTLGGKGYWLSSGDGGVFAFGDASFYGSMAGQPLSTPIVAIASTPTSEGYWLLTADGQVFAFGDAEPFLSPLKGLSGPVVDLDLTFIGPILHGVSSVQSAGYDRHTWGALVVNSAGSSLIPSGEAESEARHALGSLVAPIVAVAAPDFGNFQLAAADGGVFTFGVRNKFHGSMAGKPLNAPVVDVVASSAPEGTGYLLAAADGGVFAFGNAPFLGSMAGKPLNAPIVGMS